MIDLHIHSTASADGQYSPDVIVSMAAKLGLLAIAFVDHNSVASVKEGRRLCKIANIEFIEAIEFNSDFNGRDIHILGYGVDPDIEDFQGWLHNIEQSQIEKGMEWAKNLKSLGLKIDYKEAADLTPGKLPTGSSFLRALAKHDENRAHPLVAPYLPGGKKSENPYVDFYFEVLAEGPARSDITFQTTLEVIEKLRNFKALPVLAHPVSINEDTLERFIEVGLVGIEAASSYHDKPTTEQFLKIAQKYNLIATAGSDYHGPEFKKHVALGNITPNDISIFHALKNALARQ